MTMNTQGRPTQAEHRRDRRDQTFTGHRGLDHEEALIFERRGSYSKTGVDLPEPKKHKSRLGGLERKADIGLPGLTEPEAMRHYVRLSRKNYAIDSGLYPLGSCTMKHNARLNEKMARLPGFGDIHPLQPQSTVQGAIQLMETLAGYLLELTGMAAVAMSPRPARTASCAACWRSRRRTSAAKGLQALGRAGAGIGARHQSGDGGLHGLLGEVDPGARRRHGFGRRR